MLVVKSKVKEHTGDLNVAGDFAEGLDKEVEALIAKACARCKANGRKTVQARDLWVKHFLFFFLFLYTRIYIDKYTNSTYKYIFLKHLHGYWRKSTPINIK